jgi:hypothetical protein
MPKPGGEGAQAKPDYRRQGPCAMIVTMAYDEDLASVAVARALPPREKK